jgi:hypothetical protein
MLLEHAYSENGGVGHWHQPIIRMLANQFGSSISSRSLRHAVLTYSAKWLPEKLFLEKLEYHRALSIRALSLKIRNPKRIDEADVFASWFLSQISYFGHFEASCHAAGCISMLAALSENVTTESVSMIRTVFEPYLFDRATRTATAGYLWGSRRYQTLLRWQPTFQQRVMAYDMLNQFNHPSKIWRAGRLEAVDTILSGCLEDIALCVSRAAWEEVNHNFPRSSRVDDILNRVRAELDDPEFQQVLGAVRELRRTSTSGGYEDVLPVLQLLHLKSFDLGRTVLEAPSILEGMDAAGPMARSLLISYRSMMREPRLSDYLRRNSLLLAGLALRAEDVEERDSNSNSALTGQ